MHKRERLLRFLKKVPIWLYVLYGITAALAVFLIIYFWVLPGSGRYGTALAPAAYTDERPASADLIETRGPSASETASPSVTPRPKPATPTVVVMTPTITPTGVEGQPLRIGESVNGLPLEVYRFGSGEIVRVIAAGIHGGYEWNTVDLAYELIDHLRENPEVIPDSITLYILPLLNPDGYANGLGPVGRGNANGVDINRNWDAQWQAEYPRTGCWNTLPITAGKYPHSEPEVQAFAAFLKGNSVDALISYHSAALGILPGGQPPDEDSISLAIALAGVSTYAYPPMDTGCLYTGTMTDWASQLGIAAVDVELTNHHDTEFEMNLLVLEAFLAWRHD